MAFVRLEHVLVEALYAHLDFGAAERAHKGERLAVDGVGASFNDEAHVAVRGIHVALVLAENVVERGGLHGRYVLPSVIFAVEFTNRLGVRFAAFVYALLGFSACLSKRFGVVRNACFVVERASLGFVLVGECTRSDGSIDRIDGVVDFVVVVFVADFAPLRKRVVVRGDRRGLLACVVGALRIAFFCVVERAEQFAHEPDAIAFGVIVPCAAQHDELDFVSHVPHALERSKARRHLQIGVKAVAFCTLACGLVVQIAFRHAHIIGAIDACARAEPRLGYDGDGRHARRCASRLHAQRLKQKSVFVGRNVPRGPALRVALAYFEKKRQCASFRDMRLIFANSLVVGAHDIFELVCRERAFKFANASEYVQNEIFHTRIVTEGVMRFRFTPTSLSKSRDLRRFFKLPLGAHKCSRLGTEIRV